MKRRATDRLSEPPEKKRRVAIPFIKARIPFMSMRALAAIFALSQVYEFPEHGSKQAIARARDKEALQMTTYGALHQDLHVGPCKFEVQAPLPMLVLACQTEAYGSLIAERYDAKPCTPDAPWGVILYLDEVSPGNQLSHKNLLKSQCVYWSLSVFAHYLSNEYSWFTAFASRSSRCDEAPGGIGGIIGAFVKKYFLGLITLHVKLPTGRMVQLWLKHSAVIFIRPLLAYMSGAAQGMTRVRVGCGRAGGN